MDKCYYAFIYNCPNLTSLNLNNLEEFYCNAYNISNNGFAASNVLFVKPVLQILYYLN